MSAQTVFVTGTDTGVGKTRVAVGLLQRLRQLDVRAVGYKPVASGCERTPQGLRNDDALQLLAASSPGVAYEQINPLALEPAIAPHLAARDFGQEIDLAQLSQGHAELARTHDWVVVEGAGGWEVPLTPTQTFADWVAAQSWPVILVVGLRLGCINHALLSADAIRRRTHLVGWVANRLPPLQENWQDNLQSLIERMPAPWLGTVPPDASPDQVAAVLAERAWPLT